MDHFLKQLLCFLELKHLGKRVTPVTADKLQELLYLGELTLNSSFVCIHIVKGIDFKAKSCVLHDLMLLNYSMRAGCYTYSRWILEMESCLKLRTNKKELTRNLFISKLKAIFPVVSIVCSTLVASAANAEIVQLNFPVGYVGQFEGGSSAAKDPENNVTLDELGIDYFVIQQETDATMIVNGVSYPAFTSITTTEPLQGNDTRLALYGVRLDGSRTPVFYPVLNFTYNSKQTFGFFLQPAQQDVTGYYSDFYDVTLMNGGVEDGDEGISYALVDPTYTVGHGASYDINIDGNLTNSANNPDEGDLNSYLEALYASNSIPAGPVTVTAQNICNSDASFDLSGNATLGVGDSLTVNFNGTNYYHNVTGKTSTISISGNSWSVQGIDATILSGSYDVIATIRNTSGYSLSDSTLDEISVSSNNCASPELTLVKTSSLSGDTITYTYTATNSGDVTLTSVGVSEVTTGSNAFTGTNSAPSPTLAASQSGVTGASSDTDTDEIWDSLAVGESVTWTASYTLSQADKDAGGVTNQALGSAKDPDNGDVTDLSDDGDTGTGDTGDDPTDTPFIASPELTLVKSVDTTSTVDGYSRIVSGSVVDMDADGVVSAGDRVYYDFVVTNTGNVTVSNIALTDADADAGSVSSTVISSLAPEASDSTTWAAGAYITLTQDHIDAGTVGNQAVATGDSPIGTDEVSDTSGTSGDNDTRTDLTLPMVTVDDYSYGNEIGAPASVNVLDNDRIGSFSPDVKLVKSSGQFVTELVVAGEGTWTVDEQDVVTFAPEVDFFGDPTEVEYVLVTTGGDTSNRASIYIDYLGVATPDELVAADDELVNQDPTSPVTVSPLLNDANGQSGELDKTTLRLLDANNEPVSPSTPLVIQGEGTWTVDATSGDVTFTPEEGFDGSSVSVKYYVENYDGLPQTATIKILFIDPRGVVYDSATSSPISGVTLEFAYADGSEVPSNCFPDGQQPQTTGSDGRYRFDLSTACTTSSGVEFQILVTDAPDGYSLTPDETGYETGPLNPGTPSSALYEVVSYNNAPTVSDVRSYYTLFFLGSNSKQVVNNHIPLSRLIPEIEDDLLEILKDDLSATMTQQSRQMSSFAKGALSRLRSESSDSCTVDLNAVEPVLFDNDSSVVRADQSVVLDELAGILATCENTSFEIAGHTDSNASDAYNIVLSQARVDAIRAALIQRGIDADRLVSQGYGESRPVADNATVEGRALNRRVEFVPLSESIEAEAPCNDEKNLSRTMTASITDKGINASGDLYQEDHACGLNSWRIVSGNASYLKTTDGMAQGMMNLSVRREEFVNNDRVSGRFVGAYASQNAVTGLATGDIKGFGLNAGLYGAERLQEALYLDYYLGAAAGRHFFDLEFDRASGAINTTGHYSYRAFFAGAALSGEMDLGEVTAVPRIGVDLAYSPGGDVAVTAARGAVEDAGNLSLGSVSGMRTFAEIGFLGLSRSANSTLSITPRAFCDRAIGSSEMTCGFGGSVELSSYDADSGLTYGVKLTGEKSGSQSYSALEANYTIPLDDWIANGGAQIDQSGNMGLSQMFSMNF